MTLTSSNTTTTNDINTSSLTTKMMKSLSSIHRGESCNTHKCDDPNQGDGNNVWSVHKFGGTSLSTPERYRHVAKLITTQRLKPCGEITNTRLAVVVSAQGALKQPQSNEKINSNKVTSMLLQCTSMASVRDIEYEKVLMDIYERHHQSARELIVNIDSRQQFLDYLQQDIQDLKHILRSVWLSLTSTCDDTCWWSGYGEVWSARLLRATLIEQDDVDVSCVCVLNAYNVLVVNETSTGFTPNMKITQQRLQHFIHTHSMCTIIIITGMHYFQLSLVQNIVCVCVCEDEFCYVGYVCCMSDGRPAVLGRDGSDFTASIFAALLAANNVTIWTDVNGVYSADPNVVTDAVIRDELSYEEAMELAYFGAKILHPKTMLPVMMARIPIIIRNTFELSEVGTIITHTDNIALRDKSRRSLIQGFSCISNLSLINVEGCGMMGVPGVAARLFGAIHHAGCSVVIITQGGSEHSVCFAVPTHQQQHVMKAVCSEFSTELSHHHIASVSCISSCSCIAAVGDDMHNSIGVAARFLSALGNDGVNIHAIAQGSSQRNISVIIDHNNEHIAIQAVHRTFVQKKHKIKCVVWCSMQFDQVFIDLLLDRLLSRLNVCLVGVSDGIRMMLFDDTDEIATPREWHGLSYEDNTVPCDIKLIMQRMTYSSDSVVGNAVLIDCSTDANIALCYESLVQAGIRVVCATNYTIARLAPHIYQTWLHNHSILSLHILLDVSLPILHTAHSLVKRRTLLSCVSVCCVTNTEWCNCVINILRVALQRAALPHIRYINNSEKHNDDDDDDDDDNDDVIVKFWVSARARPLVLRGYCADDVEIAEAIIHRVAMMMNVSLDEQ